MPATSFDMKVDPYVLEAKANFLESPELQTLNINVPNKNFGNDSLPYEPDYESAEKIIAKLNNSNVLTAKISDENQQFIQIARVPQQSPNPLDASVNMPRQPQEEPVGTIVIPTQFQMLLEKTSGREVENQAGIQPNEVGVVEMGTQRVFAFASQNGRANFMDEKHMFIMFDEFPDGAFFNGVSPFPRGSQS